MGRILRGFENVENSTSARHLLSSPLSNPKRKIPREHTSDGITSEVQNRKMHGDSQKNHIPFTMHFTVNLQQKDIEMFESLSPYIIFASLTTALL